MASVQIRVTSEQKQAIINAATRDGLDVSAWMLREALAEAERGEWKRQPGFRKKLSDAAKKSWSERKLGQRTTHWHSRKCQACNASEKGQCAWCHRRRLAAHMVSMSEQDPTTFSDGTVLDRLFWLDAAADVLREHWR